MKRLFNETFYVSITPEIQSLRSQGFIVSDRKVTAANRIPIRFENEESDERAIDAADVGDDSDVALEEPQAAAGDPGVGESIGGADAAGPQVAELIASRAELKRLQNALNEAQDALRRRQADFENYRKRVERERTDTYNRLVGELARKLLPVTDNLSRALDAERTLETSESEEFRHFLHGVELINKQLTELLESFGVEPIPAVGEPFDPHVHEAVVTEPSDEHEPDTVIEELARGYRIGDRLLRPAMVKVAAQKIQ
jgi:molecular chaperone GrpE